MSEPTTFADAERRRGAREAYLHSPRALTVCARELDRLGDAVAQRAKAVAAQLGAVVEIRRQPGRCIVQLGPVALTLSWVRDASDSVADGCLLVGEWDGVVARGGVQSPERSLDPRLGRTAKLVREAQLVADATAETDWRWRTSESEEGGEPSDALAERSVDALAAQFRARTS